ncbi:autotransporter domain-containing protein [Bosea sp. (in: a-proteobacteria)]|uniref:autotransporter domain-containing protein n=1 Tax=Bosea sp. (in: a-proteobacteria) TaxID=1871050 RepID=UPI002DDCEDDF|nr:autotransporter domain-containing protein [Bosea sp. (in: a-proteobacteria)]HEV2509259.1 autotransporter domain-containing protein [Bosea sp. (in: a-proteobacteria)]
MALPIFDGRWGGLALRLALLAGTALVAPAHAQNATWHTAPISTNFNAGLNWDTGFRPTGTAFFGTSTITNLSFANDVTIGEWTFNANAANYSFNNNRALEFTGAGIVVNGGSATISNSGDLYFRNASSAGSASITNSFFTEFHDTSTAGNATITNMAYLLFYDDSTAGSATIVNTGAGLLNFHTSSTAGNASITNNGSLSFYDTSSAGSATITNKNSLIFYDSSSADSATIVNESSLIFRGFSTAGTATITTAAGATTQFIAAGSSAGARFITQAGGTVDISDPAGLAAMTAGSIEGAGNYVIGAKQFTVGSNNLSTEVSGVISGSGSLVKTGTGTLTLSGVSTYSGATTVSGGTLLITGSIASGTVTNAATLYYADHASAGSATIINSYVLSFINDSTAGSATITNNSITGFSDAATAGSAIITNNDRLQFSFSSTAGNSTITNAGSLIFYSMSTAGSANITNNNNFWILFRDFSTAGNATITNNSGGDLIFDHASTAGDAAVTNSGNLRFYGTSTASSATITNNRVVGFYDTSTAGNATITNSNHLSFDNASTAGSATITGSGGMAFLGSSTAGSAIITTSGGMAFLGSSTAGSATITSNYSLIFFNVSTAGGATITNNSDLYFYDTSTAGNAAITNNAGRTVDFSGSTGPNGDRKLSAGSIAGAGNYVLGANELTIGSNNLSTEVSGDISGAGGSLVKTGTGTLILTGAKTYTGGTTISAGTLQFGNGVSSGSINLAGSVNVTGGTLAIQAPTTLSVAQTVTFGDSTTLSIAAGTGSPALSANSMTIGNGVTFNLGGISDASQLDMVLIDTASGISGDFASISVGGFSGTVDYLTLSTRKSDNGLQYLASYGLAWSAHNNLAHGTFTLTNATDSFTVGAVLADQAANPATGWNGTSLTKAGAGTLILTGTNTYTGGTTIAGGTLQIGNGGTTGSILGDVVNNGQLVFNRSGSLGFSGAISGTGGLTKTGTGTLTLSGTNTYSGATSIEAGALFIDAARAMSAASDYAVASGATLQISDGLGSVTAASIAGAGNIQIGTGTTLKAGGSNASTTFSGSISGNGGLDKTGTGTLTLTGTNTYTGSTKVSGGKLVVNGSIASSVTLDGGTLGGSGTIGGVSVGSGGTISPGNSIGSLTISGNVAFASGSTYQVEVNAAGQSDRIVASGSASITGGTVQVLAENGNYAAATSYTILTASGGVSGTFTSVTSNLAFLTPSLAYDSQNVTLTMTRNGNSFGPDNGGGTAGNAVAATRNQGFIAIAAERLGVGNPVYDALISATAAEARAGFDLLSGEAHAQAVAVMIDESRLVRDTILGHLRGPLLTAPGQQVAGAFTADLPGRKGGVVMPTPVPQPRYALWGTAFGSTGNTDADGNAASMSRRSGGALLGADVMVYDAPGSSLKLGVAGGYSQSRFDLDARFSTGKLESGHAALYAGARFGNLRFDAGAAYTWSESDIRRQVQIRGFGDLLRLQRPGSVTQGFAELGYAFAFSGVALEPFAQLALIRVSTDSGSERGGAAALRVLSSDQTLGFTTLGLRAEAQLGAMPLFARAMLGWRHGFGDLTPQARTAFVAGTTPAQVFAAKIDREALVAEAGLDWRISQATALGLTYSAAIGERSRDHALKGRVEMQF